MKNCRVISILYAFVILISNCKGQKTFGEHLLVLQNTIQLPSVKGRIDHLDVDAKNKILYVAALGNNSLEVIDLQQGKWIRSVKSLDEPQGVAFVPSTNEVMVANGGNGDCYFFNATNFEKVATTHLSSDADDVRYDSADHLLYVGYGEGGISIIDAITHKQVSNIALPAHPEGFQVGKGIKKIIVNLPDQNSIGIIDLSQLKLVNTWRRNSPTANFPMAIDLSSHRVFIGYRHPAKLVVFDIGSGKEIASASMVADADDVYYDESSKRVYVSGGGGSINIFQFNNDTLSQVASIPTRDGARTSLLIPALHYFIVAVRSKGENPAEILVYKTAQ